MTNKVQIKPQEVPTLDFPFIVKLGTGAPNIS